MADDSLTERLYPKTALQLAWITMLGRYQWDWFCTFTLRESKHPEAAAKLFRYFVTCLNAALYGRHWQRRPGCGVFFCNALEYQRRGVLHFHSLFSAPVDLNEQARRLFWMDFWNRLAGFAKIEKLDSQVNVTAYVSKYVVKGGELELSANLRAYAKVESLGIPTR